MSRELNLQFPDRYHVAVHFDGENSGVLSFTNPLTAKAQAAAGEAGSQAWYLAQSSRGEQLFNAGRVTDAEKIFRAVLEKLGGTPSYERAVTLVRLSRCFTAGGRPDVAAQHARDAIAILRQLEQTDSVKRHHGRCLNELADALTAQGRYAEARQAYEDGFEVAKEFGDFRQQGVTLGQLGMLVMVEGDLNEAAERYRAALALFQQLGEPAMEAVAWHQLGMVFEGARQWDEAERHYRESARIKEQQGDLAGAAATWNQLAMVGKNAGKPEAAEKWYRKAIEGFKAVGDKVSLATCLSNLANLLQDLPGRLAEARRLAEEALAIKQTLDPGAAEIWKTYNILAEIADKEGKTTSDLRLKVERQGQAREYHRFARDAKRNFPGTRYELRQYALLILTAVLATQQPEQRKELELHLQQREQRGWTNLVAAIRRFLAGERSSEVLCEGLDLDDSMIIETILHGLADPSTLQDLLPEQEEK